MTDLKSRLQKKFFGSNPPAEAFDMVHALIDIVVENRLVLRQLRHIVIEGKCEICLGSGTTNLELEPVRELVAKNQARLDEILGETQSYTTED